MDNLKTPKPYKLNEEIALFLNESREEYMLQKSQSAITFDDFLSDRMLIIAAIRRGIPFSMFELVKSLSPFSDNDWAELLNISLKSLQRYKAGMKHHFKPIHSEKIIEMAEVTKTGLDVFGSMEKFKLWLDTPNFALGKMKPMELLMNSYGKEMVMGELTRINYGILA